MGKVHARVGDQLTLYVRQLAWLNAVPKPPEGSKRAGRLANQPKPSRAEAMKANKVTPQMPPIVMPHIVERLLEIGLQEAVGMGAGPVSWSAINAWQAAVGVVLAPWEARLIRQLSVAYVAEGRKAEAETCPAPWRAAPTESDRAAEARELRAFFKR